MAGINNQLSMGIDSLREVKSKNEPVLTASNHGLGSYKEQPNPKQIDSASDNSDVISKVKNNLQKLNQFIPITSTNLSFEFDDKTDPPFIRVVDKDNNEVIREIPSEEFREVAKALDEFADKLSNKGFILDKTV
jgi:flagellar protein FlaG